MNLAARLRQAMRDKDMTQEILGESVGVSQVAIGKILSGKTVNPRNILEIARALDVDAAWLKAGSKVASKTTSETKRELLALYKSLNHDERKLLLADLIQEIDS